MDCRLAIV